MRRFGLAVALAAVLVGSGYALGAATGYRIVIHHGNGQVWAEFPDAGTGCRYSRPGTLLCYSTAHTKRGDYGVFFTLTGLRVVRYEPGRFAVRLAVRQR